MDEVGSHSETDKDQLIEELREAVRARDEFVAIAAHELRNPITPIMVQVSLLLAAARDARRCRPELLVPRLEMLEFATQEFVRRSTMLLDVSRIAAGNIRIEPAEIDVSGVIRNVVTRAGIGARMARSDLEPDLQDGIVGVLDELALEQVVENLLSNAIKFGAGKPVGIAFRSDGRTIQLHVQDQGIGMSEDDRARIFQRFEHAVTQREHGGFGIGLWLTNQLVAAMNGVIAVESAPGKGTIFRVTLPLDGIAQQRTPGA
jgi:two-component system OmpR family sensor kinase